MKLDDKVEQYINLRDRRTVLKKAYSETDEELKNEMKLIEMDILEFLDSTGQQSAKTEHGTAYKEIFTSVTVADGQKFFDFVLQNDAIDLLEKRVNKTAYRSYKEDGIDVPGVNIYQEAKVKIRKS